MIHENVEFHNIVEMFESPGGGLGLLRVPQGVREHLNEAAKYRVTQPASAEIRFVSDGAVKIILSCPQEPGTAVIFFGGFRHGGPVPIGREKRTIEIPPLDRFNQVLDQSGREMPFSHRVCRVMLGDGPVCFHGIEGDGLRPPAPQELPKLRYLAYGTSITHGAAAIAPHLCYASQAARRIGADLINLGLGGAAQCERELADYIASRGDWHIASLALSVNMLGFTNEEFYDRVSYMVSTVAGADTKRPVACITLYSFFGDIISDYSEQAWKGTPQEKRQLLRDAVAACGRPNVHLIEGTEMLTDMAGLTTDLIHPADDGMIQIGRNLAARLQAIINRASES